MKLYVAGPMRGYDQFNFPAFDRAAAVLRAAGHEAISPAEMDREAGLDETANTSEDFDVKDALRRDFEVILSADGIVMLPGWEDSTGANAERFVAETTGRAVYELNPEWLCDNDWTPTPGVHLTPARQDDNGRWYPLLWMIRTVEPVEHVQPRYADAPARADATEVQADRVIVECYHPFVKPWLGTAAELHCTGCGRIFPTSDPAPGPGRIVRTVDRSGIPTVTVPDALVEPTHLDEVRVPDGTIAAAFAGGGPHEVRIVDPATGGEKGSKLARFDLIPGDALEEVAKHFGRGALKYADRNWEQGYAWHLSFAALNRHLWAWWQGEDTDAETGSLHTVAVAWHALALLAFQLRDAGTDDRP